MSLFDMTKTAGDLHCTCNVCAEEAWERMTFGGVQLTPASRTLLHWLRETRVEEPGRNRWTVYAVR